MRPFDKLAQLGQRLTPRRAVVEPEHLEVAPEVRGRPLAPTWRRALALLIDLSLVVLLTRAFGVFLGLAAALAFFLIAVRGSEEHWLRRRVRALFAFCGAVILFVTIIIYTHISRSEPNEEPTNEPTGEQVDSGQADGGQTEGGQAEDGQTDDIASRFLSLFGGGEPSDDAMPSAEKVAELLEAYAMALRQDDAAMVDKLEPAVQQQLEIWTREKAEMQKAELHREIVELEAEIQELKAEIARLENDTGFEKDLERIAARLGLTFGWAGLYFTLSLAWWNGQTPGKRMLGLRVVRLDASPLGLWESFERFGGYTANLATGLLGFFQVTWDANRQAFHDKLAGTVVVLDRPAK